MSVLEGLLSRPPGADFAGRNSYGFVLISLCHNAFRPHSVRGPVEWFQVVVVNSLVKIQPWLR